MNVNLSELCVGIGQVEHFVSVVGVHHIDVG